MKYFNFLITVTAFVMLVSACKEVNDIVDSDKNIKITKIELGKVRENQETGIIMPLKAGNEWFYRVTDYDNFGNVLRKYNTSVKVNGEKIIDNEKWFEVQFPMISEKYPVYMTNTDVGLFSQCPGSPEYKGSTFLTAKYPDINNTFYSGFIIDTITTTSTFLDSSSIWQQSSNQSINVPKGDFNCVKYAGYYKSQNPMLEGKPFMTTYFTPDFGLVKAEIYPPGAQYIRKVYELIDNPYEEPTYGCVHSETLDIGDIQIGKTLTISRIIKNTGLNEYEIHSYFVSPNEDIIAFSNIKPNAFESLKPGQYLSFDLKVTPAKTGTFKSNVMFLYTIGDNSNEYKCWFGIDITGNCVD